jgi:hypothetical protein
MKWESTGAPAALLWSTAGTKSFDELLLIIAIISLADTLTTLDVKRLSWLIVLNGILVFLTVPNLYL